MIFLQIKKEFLPFIFTTEKELIKKITFILI